MKTITFLALIALASCASTKPGPIVQHASITDTAKIAADVAYCDSQATTIIAQQGKKGGAATGAVKGSAKGAAASALGSAIYGGNSSQRKTSAKYGAALGALAGAAGSKKQREAVKRNIQSDCLTEKGYKIYGWN
ncbi:hypothetical protein [Halobacteriovorax sp. HLS]|uniref:hypothetical protein n=1 Tax=Halobacteriovorax sp. HLS TaxID=2234000 RepID=UPI000FD954C7|nr:hypothetical protein [Halobacteriovorax sp. HLS]